VAEPVTLVRNAAVAINSSQRERGALQARRMARASPHVVPLLQQSPDCC
jgi:hypothetical protein